MGAQWSGRVGDKADASSHGMIVPEARGGKDAGPVVMVLICTRDAVAVYAGKIKTKLSCRG